MFKTSEERTRERQSTMQKKKLYANYLLFIVLLMLMPGNDENGGLIHIPRKSIAAKTLFHILLSLSVLLAAVLSSHVTVTLLSGFIQHSTHEKVFRATAKKEKSLKYLDIRG